MHDAIYQIAPAIDVTAKKRYPTTKNVGRRIKSFIRDEQTLIYFLSSQGKIALPDDVRIVIVDRRTNKPLGSSPDHRGELADFVYHNVRCAQSHEGEIDCDYIDFDREFGIGRFSFNGDGGPLQPGLFIVSRATVLALILAVICSPENANLQLPGDISLFGRVLLQKEQLPGHREYLMTTLQQMFGAAAGDA